MIDFYTWTTPNGYKVAIMLEETGLAYEVRPVNIRQQEQFAPDFLKISPNNKIPAIVDRDGDGGPISVFESGAILIYLAEKSGKFLAPKGAQRAATLEWLMFQMASIGPMFGQLSHFTMQAPEKVPYAIERYTNETLRLMGVLEKRLGQAAYIAGDYSIADIATYPWMKPVFEAMAKQRPDDFADKDNIRRWLDAVGSRPAVARGMHIPTI